MHRRSFLGASLAAGLTGSGPGVSGQEVKREYYELRLYHLRIPQRDRFNAHLRDALVPALNRAGIKTVGVFNVLIGPDSPTVYLLIPYPALDALAATQQRLEADADYQKALQTPAADPLYLRIESSLLVAFESLPRLEVPKKEPRMFELRTYESPTESAHLKKMEMFTPKLGELEIFRRSGLQPVFFGRTLIGPRLPSFTYLLTYPDMTARAKNWNTFVSDPAWKKLSATPGYTDPEIMTNISNVFLSPAPYSQV
jgi:NIPSNAP